MALWYKLQSFEVPIVGVNGEPDGPALVCCDYQGIVANSSSPIATLSREYVSINYHSVREGMAVEILMVSRDRANRTLRMY